MCNYYVFIKSWTQTTNYPFLMFTINRRFLSDGYKQARTTEPSCCRQHRIPKIVWLIISFSERINIWLWLDDEKGIFGVITSCVFDFLMLSLFWKRQHEKHPNQKEIKVLWERYFPFSKDDDGKWVRVDWDKILLSARPQI